MAWLHRELPRTEIQHLSALRRLSSLSLSERLVRFAGFRLICLRCTCEQDEEDTAALKSASHAHLDSLQTLGKSVMAPWRYASALTLYTGMQQFTQR
eukprot:812958-Amphidinium_carterae.2